MVNQATHQKPQTLQAPINRENDDSSGVEMSTHKTDNEEDDDRDWDEEVDDIEESEGDDDIQAEEEVLGESSII